MSKKCMVYSLGDHALIELGNLVISALTSIQDSPELELNQAVVMVSITDYMEMAGATASIYQDLLRYILNSDLEAMMRFTCIQMLLNNGVQYLATKMFPISYHRRILRAIATYGTGLRVLNLKGVWVKEEQMPLMYEVIRNCRQLTKLQVPYIANDELLEEISYFLSYLQALDISGETDITDIGLDALSKGVCRETLTVIDIGMPGEENICHSDVALVLESCPNVVTFSTYSYVGLALKYVYNNINLNFKCKLKYIHDTNTNLDTLQCIVRMCPKLESLYLDSPEPGILHELSHTRLYNLKIFKFYSHELMELLHSMGCHLRHLALIKGIGSIELCHLFRLCTSLCYLDCYKLERLTFMYYINNEKPLVNIQGLELVSSPISIADLKSFLCHAHNIKRLAIDMVAFDDNDMFEYVQLLHFI